MTHKTTTTIDDALEADFAAGWKPEPGEKLVGTVIAIGERPGFQGRSYPIVTIEPDEGEPLAVHAFHGVLMDELAKVGPKIGERIGVKYVGKVAGGDRSYHSYRVAVDRPTAAIDWSTYSEDVPAASDVPASSTSALEAEAVTAAASAAAQDERDSALGEWDDVPA